MSKKKPVKIEWRIARASYGDKVSNLSVEFIADGDVLWVNEDGHAQTAGPGNTFTLLLRSEVRYQ